MSTWIGVVAIASLCILLMFVDKQGDFLWGIVGGTMMIIYVVRELRARGRTG